MSDLFHDQIDWRFIARVFAVMAACPQHIFIVLTKRHGRMRSLLNQDSFIKAAYLYWLLDRNIPGDSRSWPGWPLPNVWLLVSAENQKWADIRIPALLATPAAVRGVSAEPLLGPIGFRPGEWLPPLGGGPRVNLAEPWAEPGPTLDWVIVGGESGPGAREMRPNWARWIVEECQVTGTPVFVKQMGRVLGREFDAGPKGGDWDRWPADLRIREFPRVGEAA
jgi:protein gp37